MYVFGEHFHALRKCFVSFGQSVDSLIELSCSYCIHTAAYRQELYLP
jgi:hypothetical protein